MTSWKSWSRKLGLGIAVATSAIASCGYYALAENTEKSYPPAQSAFNMLHLKSLSSDGPANNPSLDKIYIRVAGQTWGPYPINPRNDAPLDINICFNNTLTVDLFSQVNQENPEFVGEKPVLPPLPLEFGDPNRIDYTMNYEIVPGGCN